MVKEKPTDQKQTTENRAGQVLTEAQQAAPELAALVSARDPKRPLQADGSQINVRKPSALRVIQERLESSLRGESIEAVTLIAMECGYQSDYKMRRDFPEVCSAILRKKKARSQMQWAQTEAEFVKALQEEPPPSLEAMCTRLKVWPDVVKRKLPSLASKIVKRAKSYSTEQHRKRLTELLPIAHLMTPKDVLKTLHSSAATLMKQCLQEYSAVMNLVRNPRREAVELRRARLDKFLLEQVQFEMRNGCRTTLNAMHAALPKDCRTGYADFSAALQEARRKLAAPLTSVSPSVPKS
jgi:hypothetical protein